MEYVNSIKIMNSKNVEMRFDLEPWGDQHVIQPGTSFTIIAKSPFSGYLEVDIQENVITVYGWTGSTIQLFRDDGIEIEGSSSIPVPRMP